MEVPRAGVAEFSVGARETWDGLLDSDEVLSGCPTSGDVEKDIGTEGAR